MVAAPDTRVGSPEEALLQVLLDRWHRVEKRRRRLRHITIEITGRCNLSCRHCYMRSGPARPRKDLRTKELIALGYQIRTAFGTRVPIAITGGEPLARKDLFLLLGIYRLLGLRVSVATNGTLLGPRAARRLAGLTDGLSISLDGTAEEHASLRGPGSFEAALRGIRRAADAGVRPLVVKTAVSRLNLRALPALHRLVRATGATEWHLFPVEAIGRGRRLRRELLPASEHAALCAFFDAVKRDDAIHVCFAEQNSFLRKRPAAETARLKRCLAGISTLAILHDGRVVACVEERGAAQGNVREEALAGIWERGFERNRSPDWRCCGCHLSPSGASGRGASTPARGRRGPCRTPPPGPRGRGSRPGR